MTMHELEGEPFFADPREVLRQVVSKFDDLGLTICAAFELEFYLIDQENVNGRPSPTMNHHRHQPRLPLPISFGCPIRLFFPSYFFPCGTIASFR